MSSSKVSQLDAADRRNKLIAGAAGVLMVGVLWWVWQDSGAPTPPSATVATPQTAAAPSAPAVKLTLAPGNAAGTPTKIGSTAGALDPTLHMQAMLVTEAVTYTGSGRNIFAAPGQVDEVVASAIPHPVGPARTGPATPPPRQMPPPPQGPPPIELKFFGMVTSPDGQHRQAMLLHGDDVFLATKGDIVQRKYRVIDIGPNSIQVEDLSNNNRQTLPLQATP